MASIRKIQQFLRRNFTKYCLYEEKEFVLSNFLNLRVQTS